MLKILGGTQSRNLMYWVSSKLSSLTPVLPSSSHSVPNYFLPYWIAFIGTSSFPLLSSSIPSFHITRKALTRPITCLSISAAIPGIYPDTWWAIAYLLSSRTAPAWHALLLSLKSGSSNRMRHSHLSDRRRISCLTWTFFLCTDLIFKAKVASCLSPLTIGTQELLLVFSWLEMKAGSLLFWMKKGIPLKQSRIFCTR